MLKKWMNSQYFMPGIIAGIGLIGFIAVSVCVWLNVFAGFDNHAVLYLHKFSVSHFTKTAIFISQMGHDYGMIYLYFIILVVFLFKKFYREGLFFAVAMQSAFFLTLMFKEIMQRPRPDLDLQIVKVYDWSYPSGHTMKSVCLYGILLYMCLTCIRNTWLKYILVTLLSILVLLIGVSRVYLGNHYPTDVLGGFFIGLFLLGLWIMTYKAQKISKLD